MDIRKIKVAWDTKNSLDIVLFCLKAEMYIYTYLEIHLFLYLKTNNLNNLNLVFIVN